MGISRGIGGILGICLGVYMFAATIPGAISTLNTVNTTGWSAAQAALWPVISIIVFFASIAAIMPDDLL